MSEHHWAGWSLGVRPVGYADRDPILYALAVGADPSRLDLIHEDRLRVLPTFGLTLAQWAPDVLGAAGVLDPANSLHAGQRFVSRKPLPVAGEVLMAARVSAVFDKVTAAVFEVEVESDYFLATWILFAPGYGGFGGDRGPRVGPMADAPPDIAATLMTTPVQPALYRLLGDRHALHVDPEAARVAGMPKPVMHGLCTLAAATLPLAEALDVHPADLTSLSGRFTAPAFPGEALTIAGRSVADGVEFAVERTGDGDRVVTNGHLAFSQRE